MGTQLNGLIAYFSCLCGMVYCWSINLLKGRCHEIFFVFSSHFDL
jgi:hypothetical protein